MSTKRKNPFATGYGEFPPYLAGRDATQALISELLEEVADKGHNFCDIALVGPRGKGKNALLQWAEKLAEKRRGLFPGQKVPFVVRADAGCIKRKADVLRLFPSRKALVVDETETGLWGWRANPSAGSHCG